jgi:hypothetical protein
VAVQCANSSRAPQPVTGAFAASAGPSRLGLWQKSRKATPTRPRLASQRRELAVLYGRVTRGREGLCGPAPAREAGVARSKGPRSQALVLAATQSLAHLALRDRNQSLLARRRVGINGGEGAAAGAL